ncbi:WIYLD domain-containing protein [Quillaja saponaria]|uniref:WIYLD domain-containing protein n=1 Tax=Quillaja saponaria TaxID=32244 RepID=A0AAD7VJJ6_QUISA|nr:WIYLD domain-containing protein [Quillaja saponaria]
MAPRGRTRKRGQTRMDAALDAMRPYGFPDNLVKETVRELLNVYGGNDNWVFIEEDAYRLLIETILAKKNNSGEEPEDEDNEAIAADPSSPVALTCASPEAMDVVSLTNTVVDSTSPMNESESSVTGLHQVGSVLCESVGNNVTDSPPHKQSRIQAESRFPSQRRSRPCYGWISWVDEEEPDLVELTPEPLRKKLADLFQ